MMPNLNFGGFTVQTYGLLLIIAVLAGLSLSAREARRLELDLSLIHISEPTRPY